MLKKIRTFLSRFLAEGYEEIETPQGVTVTFALRYRELLVGTLRLHDGKWQFRYSPEFRQQTELNPLVAFPDLTKTYEAQSLWPFFLSRIPGISQPEIQATIQAEGLDEHSAVDLLRRFGQKTISNPFILQELTNGSAPERIAARM
jgi:HipA-like protein